MSTSEYVCINSSANTAALVTYAPKITKENSFTTAITTNCDASSMSHTKMGSAWQSRCDATRMGIAPNVVIVRVSTT